MTTYTPQQVADEMFEATIEGQGFDALTPEERTKCMLMLAIRCVEYAKDADEF